MTFPSTSSAVLDWPTAIRSPQPVIRQPLQEPRPIYETGGDSDVMAEMYRAVFSLLAQSVSPTSLQSSLLDRRRITMWFYLKSWLNATTWQASTPLRAANEMLADQQLVIEQAVVAEYAAIPQVALIYSDRYLAEYVFTVFISGDQYDDSAMDELLDREITLLERFAPRPFTFYYLPDSLSVARREMVRESAKLIFED